MKRVNCHNAGFIITSVVMIISFVTMTEGCRSAEYKKGTLQVCDTDTKSKCTGNCMDGTSPRYYFDQRRLSAVQDEADNRVKFLKKQGLGDLDDYPEILNGEKKSASFAKYIPPECDGCRAKFILNGAEVKCEEFYQGIETFNKNCGECVEIVPDKVKR